MAFLDEDQPYAPRRAPAPRRRGPERQQIAVRRAIAIGAGLLILILLVVGIKGCLDARKQRGLENFASDVNSLSASSDQLSSELFKELDNPGSSGLDLQSAIDSDRGTADGLLNRATGISAPGQVSDAKSNLVLAYQLRSDGIAGLASALHSGGSAKQAAKTADIAVDHMKELVASDVLFVRAKAQIDQALTDAGVNQVVKPSVFFQDPQRWLDPKQLDPLIASSGGGGGGVSGTACPAGKVCGLALASTTVGGAALAAGVPATLTGSTIDVSVQNQGDVTESNVQVSYRLGGAGSGSATVPSIAPGATETAHLKIKPAPKPGTSGTLQVTVQPVPGEHVRANNTASYTVTFG